MINKAHLTTEGLQQIINLRASINLGLSDLQKAEFPNYSPVERPLIDTKEIPKPNWIAGFTSGEGCFIVSIYKSKTNKIGYAVKLVFKLAQHKRDKNLLDLISNYLESGGVFKQNKNVLSLVVIKFSEIKNIIIPFFEKHKIVGLKQLDFKDFYQVANLMKEGKHLTNEGLEEIRKLKSKMNKGRD
jgi:hypothetical protein